MVGGKESLGGVPLPMDFKSILIGYVWTGDANLDGVINSHDYDLLYRAWHFLPCGTADDAVRPRALRVSVSGTRWPGLPVATPNSVA